jgi:hypothetical protein
VCLHGAVVLQGAVGHHGDRGPYGAVSLDHAVGLHGIMAQQGMYNCMGLWAHMEI